VNIKRGIQGNAVQRRAIGSSRRVGNKPHRSGEPIGSIRRSETNASSALLLSKVRYVITPGHLLAWPEKYLAFRLA